VRGLGAPDFSVAFGTHFSDDLVHVTSHRLFRPEEHIMSSKDPGPDPMSASLIPMFGVVEENLHALRRSWFFFVVLGLLLTILGIVAITYSMVTAVVAVLVLGYMLLIGGIFYIVGAFFTGAWGGFFLSLLAGVLYLATGFILVNHPTEAVIIYTLLLAV